jgi:hypothetical protein
MNQRFLLLIILIAAAIAIFPQYQNYRVSSTSSSDPEEVTIAINTQNPNQLAAGANIRYFYSSSNGGTTWTQSNMSSSLGVWGDPCLIYDGLNNLYYGHLSNPPLPGYWIDRIVVQKSTDNGLTWNQGAGIGFNSPKNQDKEWLAVDLQNTPYKNFIYATWTEFDDYGSSNPLDSSRILFSRSTDHGNTWSVPARVSDKGGNCIDEDLTVEGAVPTVGTNGEIYTAWSGPLGIMFDKSTDGGLTWGSDIFVSTQPGGWDFNVSGIYRCNGLPITACDTSRTFTRGNIYVLWGDQRFGTDNSDVFISKSTNSGQTWSSALKVNNDNTTRHQFFPWLTIDQTTGHLFVIFYDRRNTTGAVTDVYVAKSIDGGESFENFKVSQTSFTPSASIFFGDYTNIAAFNRKVYPIWMRMDGTALSVWNAIVLDSSAIIPVELTNFTSSVENGKVILAWETATELNNKGFEIERSLTQTLSKGEGFNAWEMIGFVNGGGTTTQKQFYSFIDNPQKDGIYIYRIKQVDFDGSFKYSNEIEVNFRNIANFTLLQNYPNPFNPTTTISYQVPRTSHVVVKLFDVLGSEISVLVNEIKQTGTHEITFDASELPSGLYLYRMNVNNQTFTKKMMLAK